ncbi:MAG: hypothetical protein DIU71_03350 [Proteobacteria bacterium]|nr:MAG: hypothetical protein DIU71_03350 [Pseudomonadota bacterium]
MSSSSTAEAAIAHRDTARSTHGTLRQRLEARAFAAYKQVYQLVRWPGTGQPKSVLLIVGCQRSGTTLMKRMFDRDLRAAVYGEFSRLSSGDKQGRIRLNPLPEVAAAIAQDHAPLVVMKPLVETQNLLGLLRFFPGSKAVFMFRHYRDVAASDLKRWGLRNGIDNLRPIARNEPGNWRSERVPDEVRELVAQRFSEDMNPHDAAALFWYVRNRLFFDLGLEHLRAVLPLRYESLVGDPVAMMERVYDHVGLRGPMEDQIRDVHGASVNKGAGLEISPDVQALCAGLNERLDAVFMQRLAHTGEA